MGVVSFFDVGSAVINNDSNGYVSGRDHFKKYKKTIDFLYFIFRFCPGFVKKFFFRVIGGGEGKLSTLYRYFYYKENLKNCGEAAYFAKFNVVKHAKKISIGNNFSMHEFCYLDGAGEIVIGDNVSISHNCSLISFDHTWGDCELPIKYGPTVYKKITVGSDVWIGCGVRILGGCEIGDRVVIAAGAVVKGNLESNAIYAGVPARKIKSI